MKAVLMSIKPKWCKLIFSGEKTIEVRKTAPKLETPFKVYVYCTKERMTRVPSMYAYLHKNEPRACAEYGTIETWGKIGDVIVNPHLASKHVSFGMHGKVIGSFVCDKIDEFSVGSLASDDIQNEACLTYAELISYFYKQNELDGNTLKFGYGWHITAPKLFDKPRELGEFRTIKCTNKKGSCSDCKIKPDCIKYLTRPPQSWCYVEELQ